jgi:hypothetical protein
MLSFPFGFADMGWLHDLAGKVLSTLRVSEACRC